MSVIVSKTRRAPSRRVAQRKRAPSEAAELKASWCRDAEGMRGRSERGGGRGPAQNARKRSRCEQIDRRLFKLSRSRSFSYLSSAQSH